MKCDRLLVLLQLLMLVLVSAGPAAADHLAFVRDGNIWVMSADGTDQRQLTRSGDCSSPDWSPDGTKLVYVRTVGLGEERESYLWTYDMPTATARRLIGKDLGWAGYECPRWSPDMAYIAFFRSDPEARLTEYSAVQLVKLRIAAAEIEVLRRGIYGPSSLTWSPDATRLAYARSTEGSGEVSVVDATTGSTIRARVYVYEGREGPEAGIDDMHWVTAQQVLVSTYEWTEGTGDRATIQCVDPLGGMATTLYREGLQWCGFCPSNDRIWIVRCGSLWSLRQGTLSWVANGVDAVAAYPRASRIPEI